MSTTPPSFACGKIHLNRLRVAKSNKGRQEIAPLFYLPPVELGVYFHALSHQKTPESLGITGFPELSFFPKGQVGAYGVRMCLNICFWGLGRKNEKIVILCRQIPAK